eukprot:Gb_24480 [translate_table: standard]
MGKRKSDANAGLENVEIREHDDAELREELANMDARHPIFKALEVAGIRTFLCLPPLFFEDTLVSGAVVAATRRPKKMNLSDILLHQVIGLPLQAPEPSKATKLGREQAAKEYCETIQDASKSGIQLEGLKNPVHGQLKPNYFTDNVSIHSNADLLVRAVACCWSKWRSIDLDESKFPVAVKTAVDSNIAFA